jgi:signal transduction histidine kinase
LVSRTHVQLSMKPGEERHPRSRKPDMTNVRTDRARSQTDGPKAQILRSRHDQEAAFRRSLIDFAHRVSMTPAGSPEELYRALAEAVRTVMPYRAFEISIEESTDGSPRPGYQWPGDFVAGSGDHVLSLPASIEGMTKAVLSLRRARTDPPFGPEDRERAELFAHSLTTIMVLAELAEARRVIAVQNDLLRDLNRLRQEIVANVSHELRTPLTAILGNVMTVAGLGDMLGANERRELLRAVERQAKRLAELLENLLAESRLAGRDPGLTPTLVDLRPFLEEVADTLRFRAPDRTVETRAIGRLELVTDRALLYRILFNLGDNALKYSEEAVLLEARPLDDGIQMDVIDQGEGIAADDMARIFRQFEQLDGSTSRRVGGIGIGLHLCAAAAAALGGRIWADSDPGAGSRFWVWLPSRTTETTPR